MYYIYFIPIRWIKTIVYLKKMIYNNHNNQIIFDLIGKVKFSNGIIGFLYFPQNKEFILDTKFMQDLSNIDLESKLMRGHYNTGKKISSYRKDEFGHYHCQYVDCYKKYVRLSHLKAHERNHENIKPYQCFICNKRFNRSDRLKRHIKIHEK